MTNLLEETLSELNQQKKTAADIRWIGAPDYGYVTWEEFAKVADVDYDSGYGSQKVATDLVVVGDDWWLERYEYDGAESWSYKTIPTHPEKHLELTRVAGGRWLSLEELQEESFDDDEL